MKVFFVVRKNQPKLKELFQIFLKQSIQFRINSIDNHS